MFIGSLIVSGITLALCKHYLKVKVLKVEVKVSRKNEKQIDQCLSLYQLYFQKCDISERTEV